MDRLAVAAPVARVRAGRAAGGTGLGAWAAAACPACLAVAVLEPRASGRERIRS